MTLLPTPLSGDVPAGRAPERCRFCQIAAGETPARIVFGDDSCIAFLDSRPLFPGHLLLVTRRHVATLMELPDDLAGPLMLAARLLSRAIVQAMEADGAFVAINNGVSQSIPHLHVHIVPRRKKDGLRGFFWPRQKYASEDEARAVQERIRQVVEGMRS